MQARVVRPVVRTGIRPGMSRAKLILLPTEFLNTASTLENEASEAEER